MNIKESIKTEKFWTTIISAVVTILAAFGVVTAAEGTDILTYASQIATGVLGLAGTIIAISRKNDKKEIESSHDKEISNDDSK